MKKFLTILILALLPFAWSDARKSRPSLSEIKELAAQGKTFKETNSRVKFRTRGDANDVSGLHHRHGKSASGKVQIPASDVSVPLPSRIRNIAPKGGNIYGYLNFSTIEENFNPGLFELTPDGYKLWWEDPLWLDNYQRASNGWLQDNKICGYILDLFMGYFWGYFYFEIDFQTGELLKEVEFDLEGLTSMFYIAQREATTGNIYGYATTPDGLFWAKASPSNLGVAEPILPADEDFCYSLYYNPADKKFYGVNAKQQFVTVEPSTGRQTVISNVPQTQTDLFDTYFTGLVWDPDADLFYWNACMDLERYEGTDLSRLYTITSSGEFTKVLSYPNEEEFTFFVTTDEVADPTVPARPTVVSTEFPQGALSGSVTFGLPATFGDGSPLPASIDYTVYLDDDVYSTGSGAPGSNVTPSFTSLERGMHTFGIKASANGVQSSMASTRIFVGPDTPLAPTNVTLTKTQVSWSPVTAGVHGGYIDTGSLTYNVYLNGEFLGNTGATSYAISLPEDAPIASYMATVEAVVAGYTSEAASSNKVVSGDAYNVPMILKPTYEEYELMTVVDNNRDGARWNFDQETEALVVSFTFDELTPMDDYLFLPPVKITDPDKYYTFSFEVGVRHFYPSEELIEVVYATSPRVSDVQATVIPVFQPTVVAGYYGDGEFQMASGLLKVPAAGTYYLALHAVSKGDGVGMVARNLSLVDDDITAESPAAVEDLSAKGAPQGRLEATATFTFPTLSIVGEPLPANTEMTARLWSSATPENVATTTGTPGCSASVVVPTVQGDNILNIQVTSGGYNSDIASVNVYTGVAVPATPENFKVSAAPDMMSARLTWDAVSTPDPEIDPDGYIDPSTVTYTLYTYNHFYRRWEVYLEGLTTTSYDFILTENYPQNQYAFGVGAANEAGENGYINYDDAILGPAYKLPFEEELNGYGFTTQPWFTYDYFNGEYYDAIYARMLLEEVDATLFEGDYDFVFVGIAPDGAGGKGLISMPRFTTKDIEGATVTLKMYKGPSTSFDVIMANCYGDDTLTDVGEIAGNTDDDYVTPHSFPLPASMLGKEWVQLYVESNFDSAEDMFVLSGVTITSASGVTLMETGSEAIYGVQGAVVVKGLDGKDLTVTTLDGKIVERSQVKGNDTQVALPAGIYVVKAGNKTAKVLVR